MEKIHRNMSAMNPLYRHICSMHNLWQAGHKTFLHGRRFKLEGAKFKLNYERNLLQLHRQLSTQTYRHGGYKTFIIYEPKRRVVKAAPLRDRIVHHALHDVVEPIINRKYIYDSYACRTDKGTHAAIIRAQRFMQANQYFMHLDVKKYFQSIDHGTLKRILSRYFTQPDVLNLFHIIINSSCQGEVVEAPNLFYTGPKGLPIGNLTSQFFANLYLNELDQYIKHDLKIKHYIRYMDDFVVFGNDKKQMIQTEKNIQDYCADRLQLMLHLKGGIKIYKEGLGFLGFKIFRKYKKLKSVCLIRYMRKYKQKQKQYLKGLISQNALQKSLDSWQNHILFGDTQYLQAYLKDKYSLNFLNLKLYEGCST